MGQSQIRSGVGMTLRAMCSRGRARSKSVDPSVANSHAFNTLPFGLVSPYSRILVPLFAVSCFAGTFAHAFLIFSMGDWLQVLRVYAWRVIAFLVVDFQPLRYGTNPEFVCVPMSNGAFPSRVSLNAEMPISGGLGSCQPKPARFGIGSIPNHAQESVDFRQPCVSVGSWRHIQHFTIGEGLNGM